ncbi:MAG: CBS domain-containing protein [Oscillospiraceae bacterium]|nr:CBS domain-containing protein [Oscillospiraceae bacterium]
MNIAMIMTPKMQTSYLYGDMTAGEGLREFMKTGYTAVPVTDREGLYLGVVSEREFLYRILEDGSLAALDSDTLTLADLASVTRFDSVTIETDTDTLMKKLVMQNFVPVTDSRGMYSGIVTRQKVIETLSHMI